MEIRKVDANERETIEEYLSLDEDLLYSLIPPYTQTLLSNTPTYTRLLSCTFSSAS